jgi:hypothetical protein
MQDTDPGIEILFGEDPVGGSSGTDTYPDVPNTPVKPRRVKRSEPRLKLPGIFRKRNSFIETAFVELGPAAGLMNSVLLLTFVGATLLDIELHLTLFGFVLGVPLAFALLMLGSFVIDRHYRHSQGWSLVQLLVAVVAMLGIIGYVMTEVHELGLPFLIGISLFLTIPGFAVKKWNSRIQQGILAVAQAEIDHKLSESEQRLAQAEDIYARASEARRFAETEQARAADALSRLAEIISAGSSATASARVVAESIRSHIDEEVDRRVSDMRTELEKAMQVDLAGRAASMRDEFQGQVDAAYAQFGAQIESIPVFKQQIAALEQQIVALKAEKQEGEQQIAALTGQLQNSRVFGRRDRSDSAPGKPVVIDAVPVDPRD